MARSRIQAFRSTVKGARPAASDTTLNGELYVNFPDRMLGVVGQDDATNTDLLAVRFFSAGADYAVGDYVVNGGTLYRCTIAVTAGAFNVANWTAVGTGGGGGAPPTAISDTPPASPVSGQLWWESDSGTLYVYYNDGSSSQWVQTSGPSVDIGRRRISTTPITGTTVVIPLPAGYDKFELEGCEIGATADTNPALQLSLDGTNFVGTSTYYNSLGGMSGTNSWVTGQGVFSNWNIFSSVVSFTTPGMRGDFLMHLYPGAAGYPATGRLESKAWVAGAVRHSGQGLYFANSGRVQAIRLLLATGSFTAGKVHLFGIPS